MLNFDQIRQLIDIVCERDLGGLEIEETGFRLKIDGRPTTTVQVAAVPEAAAVPVVAAAAAPTAGPPQAASAAAAPASAEADGHHVITSPIVGTFYAAPSPDSDPYVTVGGRVKKGQVLCIVEAMKLMNEIESDVNGEIVEIHPKNAQPVEFGEALFGIRAD